MAIENQEQHIDTQETIQQQDIVSDTEQIQAILDKVQNGKATLIDNKYLKFSRTEGDALQTKYIERQRLQELADNDQLTNDVLTRFGILQTNTGITNELNNMEKEVTGAEKTQLEMLERIRILYNKYKSLNTGISSSEGNGETKAALQHWLNQNIENLNKMRFNLGGKGKALRKLDEPITIKKNTYIYNNLATFKERIGELTYYLEHYEQVRQLIVLGGRTSDIHAIIDSKQDARYARRQENKDARYQSKMNDILHEAALTSLWNDDMERYEEYLEAVLNGQVEPSSHPFYTAHMQSFIMIKNTSPDLYGALVPNKRGQKRYDVYCQENGIPYCQNGLDPNRKFRTGTIGDDIATIIENSQIRRGKEVNPRQREALRKLGNIGSLVGCVALGIGILKEIFPGKAERDKRKKGESSFNRGKVLGYGASIYGITHYQDVKNIVFDTFNVDPDSYVARRQNERIAAQGQQVMGLSQTESQELADASIKYPTLVATTLGAIPINLLIEQRILEEKDGKLVLNKNNYAEYVENIAIANGRPDSDKQEMLDRISSDEAVNAISYGLTYCGIKNLNDLRSLKGSSEKATLMDSATFTNKFRTRVEAIRNQTGIFSKMADQGFIPVGLSETLKILEKYDSNKNENEQILARLQEGLLKTDDAKIRYKVSDMLSKPNIDMMDLKEMTIKGFKNGASDIKFSSYGELFHTLNVTNWIKRNFGGRSDAKSANPFHFNGIGQLEFDNAQRYELHKNEIAVLSLKGLQHMPTVKNNKEYYEKYLNDWRRSQLPQTV